MALAGPACERSLRDSPGRLGESTGVGSWSENVRGEGEAVGGRGDPVAAAALGHEAGPVRGQQDVEAVVPSMGNVATPIDALTAPPASRTACRVRSATSIAPAASVPGSRMANSSPP